MSRVVCLGEAVVDFVSEQPVEQLTDARSFAPSFGGSQANVAVGAARIGARATLAGCAGTDDWGTWLRARLADEGVDVSLYALREEVQTTIAFVALAPDAEPTFTIYGGSRDGMLASCGDRVLALVAEGPPGVLAFGSDTLIARGDRDTVGALVGECDLRGWRVLYDPNLRERRWADHELMRAVAREAVRETTVVKANRFEAALLTGAAEPAAAASALVAHGARQALVTLGAEGALLADADGIVRFEAERVELVDATGAGDAVAAVAAAALARRPLLTPADVGVAMRVAGAVVAARGALTGFPAPSEARALLR